MELLDFSTEAEPVLDFSAQAELVRQEKGRKMRQEMQELQSQPEAGGVLTSDPVMQMVEGMTLPGIAKVASYGLGKVGDLYRGGVNKVINTESQSQGLGPYPTIPKEGFVPKLPWADPASQGLARPNMLKVFAGQMAQEALQPENAMLMPLMSGGGVVAKAAELGIAPVMIDAASQSAGQMVNPELSTEEKTLAGLNTAAMGGMGIGAGVKGVRPVESFKPKVTEATGVRQAKSGIGKGLEEAIRKNQEAGSVMGLPEDFFNPGQMRKEVAEGQKEQLKMDVEQGVPVKQATSKADIAQGLERVKLEKEELARLEEDLRGKGVVEEIPQSDAVRNLEVYQDFIKADKSSGPEKKLDQAEQQILDYGLKNGEWRKEITDLGYPDPVKQPVEYRPLFADAVNLGTPNIDLRYQIEQFNKAHPFYKDSYKAATVKERRYATILEHYAPEIQKLGDTITHEAGEVLTPKYLLDNWDSLRVEVHEQNPRLANVVDLMKYKYEGKVSPNTVYAKEIERMQELRRKYTPKEGSIGAGMQAALEKNKEQGAVNLPSMKVPDRNRLPWMRLGKYSAERAEATKPQGMSKVPFVGRLFDKRETAGMSPEVKGATEAMVAHSAQFVKGKSMTDAWLRSREGAERVFGPDKLAKPMRDVIQAEMKSPGSQSLTTKQKQFVKWWKGEWEKVRIDMSNEGIKQFRTDDGELVKVANKSFFPGGITKIPESGVLEKGKRFFTGQAAPKFKTNYASEAEARKAGLEFESDEYRRIAQFMQATYRAIANKRFIKDPAMKGASNATGSRLLGYATTKNPLFQNKMFPKEVVHKLDKHYLQDSPGWLSGIDTANNTLKAVQFTADVSAPVNQGLILLGQNPARWAKATGISYWSLLDKGAMGKYLQAGDNMRVVEELVKHGGSVGRIADFGLGTKETGLLEKFVPPIRASNRSMHTFLTVAKIELYKALEKNLKPGESKAELAELVEEMVFSGKTEAIGLSHGRILGERLFFNAPSYLRAAAGLTAKAMTGSPLERRTALKALGGLAGVLLLVPSAYYAYKVNQGDMSRDEAWQRLDPTDKNFLRMPIDLETGERTEVSMQNVFMSIVGAVIKAGEAIADKDDDTSPADPAFKFFKNRFGPFLKLGEQLFTKKDFRDEPITRTEALGKAITPVSVEPLLSGTGSAKQRSVETVVQTFGANAFPESMTSERVRKFDAAARELGYMNFHQLPKGLRLVVAKRVEPKIEERREAQGEKVSTKAAAYAIDLARKHGERVQAELDEKVQTKLKEFGLEIPGYRMTKIEKGKSLRLTEDEGEKLHEFQVQETQRRLNNSFQSPSWEKMTREQKKKKFSELMEKIHDSAWDKMIQEINKEAGRARVN